MKIHSKIYQQELKHFFPPDTPLAFCLNQLRRLRIEFLNLGNVIICPKQKCIFIFQTKYLNRIEDYKATCSELDSSRKLS